MALLQDSVVAMLRIVVVGNHDVVREGITSVLEAETDLEVVADTGYVENLVDELAHVSADVVVLDHAPPHADGIEVCRVLRESGIEARVVVLVDALDTDSIQHALRAGAQAGLPKDVRSDQLIEVVRAAGSGAPETQRAMGDVDVPTLGRSQRAVLRLLVEGKTVAEIAEVMGLSEHTVRSYLRQIYRRLGVSTRAEAAAVALRLRLLRSPIPPSG